MLIVRTQSLFQALALGLLLLVAASPRPADADEGVHVDDRHGIRLEYPPGWKPVPLMYGERWIIAKYASPKWHPIRRVTRQRDLKEERHAPRLHVLYLPAQRRSGGGRYAGYVDWLLKAMQNAKQGFFLVEETKEKVGERQTTRMEHKLEKGESAQADIPRRLISWVFERGRDQFVVEFEVLEDRYEEDVAMCEEVVQTFTFATKSASEVQPAKQPVAKTYDLRRAADRAAWLMLPVAERKAYRDQGAAAVWRHARTASPSNWDMRTWPHFYFLSERSQSSSQPYVESIESLMGWLEEHLAEISDEPVPRIVYRLFADTGSYRSFYTRSGDTRLTELAGLEDPRSSAGRIDLDSIHSALIARFIRAKLEFLSIGKTADFPVWIQKGLAGVAEGRKTGKKFVPLTEDEHGYLRDAKKEKTLVSARRLMTMTRKDYTRKGSAKQRVWELQARLLFHFVLKEQSRSRLLGKQFIPRYMRLAAEKRFAQLELIRRETAEAQKKGGAAKRSLTPEERERIRIAAARRMQQQEEMLLEELILDLCNWHDREWRGFEKRFRAAIR